MKTVTVNINDSGIYFNAEAQKTLSIAEGSSRFLGLALVFGGFDSKLWLSKTGKLRRIEEITRPHLAKVKRKPEKGRSLDLFGSFWVKPKMNRNKNITQL